MRAIAAILAAGSSERLDSDTPKQLLEIGGKPVLEHSLVVFESVEEVDEIIVVTRADLRAAVDDLVGSVRSSKETRVVLGGKTRIDSTRAALDALAELDDAKLLLHDAARPFVDSRMVRECLEALDEVGAVGVAIGSADTIFEVDDHRIQAVPDRTRLRRAQTPQGFRLSVLRRAYAAASADPAFAATDDCGVVAHYQPEVEIRVVEGSEANIKITHPIDLFLADRIVELRSRDREAPRP